MGFLPGWKSPKTVEAINSVFEYLETISLAVAIALELTGMRLSSDVAWAVLVISDVGRQVYGRRDKALSEAEANLERSKLERRLEWGVISALDRPRIRAALIGSPLTGKKVWLSSVNDALSKQYADSLGGLLRTSSLDVFPHLMNIDAGFEPPGLHITGPDSEAAKMLAAVLSDNGITVDSVNEVTPKVIAAVTVPKHERPSIEVHIAGRP